MLVNILIDFDEGPRRYLKGENPDVDPQVARRWIADGKATADTDGAQNPPGTSSGTTTPFTSRALSASDNGATLVISSAQAATVGAGLGLSTVHFSNSSSGAVNATVTGTGGALINGVANGTITRSIPANSTLTMRSVGVDSYNVPDVGAGGAVTLGPFASVAALNADAGAIAAAAGSSATVTGDGIYDKVGGIWLPRSVGVDATPREIYRRAAGVTEVVYSPHPSRVTRWGGASLYDFQTAAPAMTNGSAALDSGTTWHNRQTYALTANGAGNMVASWTTSLPPGTYDPSDHYVLAIYNGAASTTSGCSVSLSGASGASQSWTVSGTGFRPGWNLIFLCSPTDTVALGAGLPTGYGSQSGVVNVGASGGGGMGGKVITGINVTFFSPVANTVHYIDCIKLSTKVVPMVCWTWDQAFNDTNPTTGVVNPFLNEVLPAFAAAGLTGATRYHALIDATGPGLANIQAALSQGWDATNGTLTRASPVTTSADMWWQYALNQQSASRNGLGHLYMGNPPGNNTSSDNAVGLVDLPKMGITYSKGTAHSAITQGVGGYGNPLSLGVTAFDNRDAITIQGLVEAAKACGTNVLAFAHFPGATLTVAQLQTALAYLRTEHDAGRIRVVTSRNFVRGMMGMAV